MKTPLVAPLLELCSSRLVRYENLPEDTQDPTLMLLMEDTDTIPERHAFLGNYRRYSSQVIEGIVELTLSDAINYILQQTDNVLHHLYDGQPPFNPTSYIKNSMPFLRVDAQFTVIESALKGYSRSRPSRSLSPEQLGQFESQRAGLDGHLEAWCNRLVEMKFEDPLIRKRVLQLLVAFSTTALKKNNGFMLKVLEHILMTWPAVQPEHKYLNEAIKDLQAESITELQRLAFKMPDNLLSVYAQLEAKIQEMSASGTLDERRLVNYKSFLFIIVHRATNIDQGTRLQRLQSFVEPVLNQWKDQGLRNALGSYNGFCEMIALDKAQRYMASRGVHRISDWGSVELDAEGIALQAELEDRQQVSCLGSLHDRAFVPPNLFASFCHCERQRRSSTFPSTKLKNPHHHTKLRAPSGKTASLTYYRSCCSSWRKLTAVSYGVHQMLTIQQARTCFGKPKKLGAFARRDASDCWEGTNRSLLASRHFRRQQR